jgi:hypothetical protein
MMARHWHQSISWYHYPLSSQLTMQLVGGSCAYTSLVGGPEAILKYLA